MSMIKAYDPFSLPLWDLDHAAFFRDDFLRLGKGKNVISAKIEWKETPEAHTLKAELPGLKKDEVKVEVLDGNMLKISGERKLEREEKGEKWHRVERSCGMFVNMFRLPENSRVDKMNSSFNDGVLTVTVPKGEANKHGAKVVQLN